MKADKTSATFCLCGCGKLTPIAPETRPARGWKKGEPMAFYPHHSKNRWPVSDGKTKVCRRCKNSLPVSAYWKNRAHKDGLQTACKECSKTAVYSYRTKHEGKVSVVRSRLKHALSHYRITAADYDRMLTGQDGVCSICQKPETALSRDGVVRRLSVDHCHATGVVRGLLCSACNHAIGKFNDDANVMRRAADYVERHRKR